MKDYNDQDYKRQLMIANSLYEMGIDNDLIKLVTTIQHDELLAYRSKKAKNVEKEIDLKNKKKI